MAVLSIQSHVAYGTVGSGAATFALQLLGHEVWALPTVAFATHTGHGPATGVVLARETLRGMAAQLDALGALARCDAILSGYVGDAETAAAIAEIAGLARARNPAVLWCCDPVMGDSGRGLFVAEAVAAAVATNARRADILLPNLFELERMTGRRLAGGKPGRAGIAAACRDLLGGNVWAVIATGIPESADRLAVVVAEAESGWWIAGPRVGFEGRPNGAGDLFAAVFLGSYLNRRDLRGAAIHAVSAVAGVIRATAESGASELALVAARGRISAPPAVEVASEKLW